MSDTYDLIVIGGGSAGLVAAGGAALLGARVALIEKNKLGGDCLYTGCVPSKSLIRSAKFASDLKRAGEFGFEKPKIDFRGGKFSAITERIGRVIKTIEHHDSPERFEQMGVEVIFGSPQFINPNEINIALKDSSESRIIKGKRFCIATGSGPFIPQIEGLSETGFITNEEVFHLKDLPKRLAILGAGAIGIELGQSFARFGSEVTIIEMAGRILIKEDEESSAFMKEILEGEGIRILANTTAKKFHKNADGSKAISIEKDGKISEIICDEILICSGRQPNSDGLDLEKAGVKFDKKQVFTDSYLRTSQKHIFAAGDITGHFQFTHTADFEAQHVIQNAFLPWPFKKKLDLSVVPWATFTEPEIARVGLTEAEAKAKYGSVKIYRVNLADNDRATTDESSKGFAKLICAGKKIIGCHIIAPHAGDLIHEFVLAMKHGLGLADLNKAIHVYPTLGKITQALATEQAIEGLTSPFVKKWFARYLKIWR